MSIIEPKTLKGFRDFLPREMMQRRWLMQTASRVYESFGFAPIDTPALEYQEILSGKGSEETDRQMYRFQDNGGRDVGMRFDLTVPLARFAAQHIGQLGTPFKRYHMAPVWRGENAQRGRYREFVQCDFDTIGTRSVMADIEMILVVDQLLREIGMSRFQIRINNRKLLNGLLANLDLQSQAVSVLRALDKLSKDGPDAVLREMVDHAGVPVSSAEKVLQLCRPAAGADANPGRGADAMTVLSNAEQVVGQNALGLEGVSELRQVLAAAQVSGIPPERTVLDISIARGLDYYTGTIIETLLDDLPEIGSVCSGGRYDNLAGMYTKQDLPGVGASLGLDRLLTAMEDLNLVPDRQSPTQVLIAFFEAELQNEYLRYASILRQAGLRVELYPEATKLKKQLKYADQKSIPAVLLIGSQERQQGMAQIKWMVSGQQVEVELSAQMEAISAHFREKLAAD